MKNTLLKNYNSIDSRFVDSGIPLDQQPVKVHEGPPYDVAVIPMILDKMSNGLTLSSILRDDPTLPRMGELITYMKRRPELWAQYMEARFARAEVYRDTFEYALEGKDKEGNETMEDVQRSRLRADGYKWLLGCESRDLYGDKKQIDVNTKIDLTKAMEQGEARVRRREQVIEGELIDIEETVEEMDPMKALGLDE